MATALVIEEERGTTTGRYHPHNGYYAGDFFAAVRTAPGTGSVQPVLRPEGR
jgi:hypothetical protein